MNMQRQSQVTKGDIPNKIGTDRVAWLACYAANLLTCFCGEYMAHLSH